MNSIDAIISLFDIDLPVLSRNKVKFENIGVRLVVSNEVAIEICNDKWRTFNTLKSIGIEQPKKYINTKNLRDALMLSMQKSMADDMTNKKTKRLAT